MNCPCKDFPAASCELRLLFFRKAGKRDYYSDSLAVAPQFFSARPTSPHPQPLAHISRKAGKYGLISDFLEVAAGVRRGEQTSRSSHPSSHLCTPAELGANVTISAPLFPSLHASGVGRKRTISAPIFPSLHVSGVGSKHHDLRSPLPLFARQRRWEQTSRISAPPLPLSARLRRGGRGDGGDGVKAICEPHKKKAASSGQMMNQPDEAAFYARYTVYVKKALQLLNHLDRHYPSILNIEYNPAGLQIILHARNPGEPAGRFVVGNFFVKRPHHRNSTRMSPLPEPRPGTA